MAQPPLDESVIRETYEAVAQTGSVEQAAMRLKLPRTTIQNRYQAALRLGWPEMRPAKQPPAAPSVPPDQVREPLQSYDEAMRQWERAIGMARDRYAGPPPERLPGTRVKYAAAGDFHVPRHHRDAVAELIARESGVVDVLVLGGDFGDAYAASTFTKSERIPFNEELAEQTACMDQLSAHFQRVMYLRGSNHMDRIEKRLRERLDPELVDAILYMTGGELSPDLVLVKRYPNVQIACWETPQGQRVPWLMVIGDVAFTHAEKYSITPGFTTRKVEEWLDDFSGALGLPEIRAVVQFHTHAMSLIPWRADKVLIEPGAMCETHSYQLGSKIGGRPQRVGYVTFEMEEGRIDFDSIRLRWLNRESERVA